MKNVPPSLISLSVCRNFTPCSVNSLLQRVDEFASLKVICERPIENITTYHAGFKLNFMYLALVRYFSNPPKANEKVRQSDLFLHNIAYDLFRPELADWIFKWSTCNLSLSLKSHFYMSSEFLGAIPYYDLANHRGVDLYMVDIDTFNFVTCNSIQKIVDYYTMLINYFEVWCLIIISWTLLSVSLAIYLFIVESIQWIKLIPKLWFFQSPAPLI